LEYMRRNRLRNLSFFQTVILTLINKILHHHRACPPRSV